MKITTIFSLLFTLLISACYLDVYKIGDSSSSYYTYSSDSHSSSSSSQKIEAQDSLYCGEHSYKIVKIGSQTWTAQNLNEIPKSGNSWCYGGFNEKCNIHGYGRLYDWEAATNVCNTCDGSWKLPSKSDYEKLSDLEGDVLRATSVWHAVFGGMRYEDESRGFAFMDTYGYWWSSTDDGIWAYYFELAKNGIRLDKFSEKKTKGYSVRCIKK